MTVPVGQTSLIITWTDHTGKVWDLTRGTEGVILDMDQTGLDWARITQSYGRGGRVHQATTLEHGVHHLAVTVGWDRTGEEYERVRREWWTQANSPFMDRAGALNVRTPGGQERSRPRLVLDSSPETTFRYDPLLGVEYPVEVWSLSGPSPWWTGTPQVKEIRLADFASTTTTTPFYGTSGKGWPLYISGVAQFQNQFMSNDGQGDMWLTWTFKGPMSRPRFGTAGGVLVYEGDLAAGETLEVVTDPAMRDVVELSSGQSRYGAVSGVYAPLTNGDRAPLVITAEAMTSASLITVTGTTQYATAF